ncbi:hypothetical protein ABRY23_09545 [Melioribacteraceae bacterium 4301-Me]|uniref:hypothetical protein n=1 Tax=Pyranulibacter aquaticus TaxID=3163344 RepID=UPI0035975A38
MKPIWFFVGLILLVMGLIITITGIYQLIYPPVHKTVLYEIHPDIWWGTIMILFGGLMYLKTRNKTI